MQDIKDPSIFTLSGSDAKFTRKEVDKYAKYSKIFVIVPASQMLKNRNKTWSNSNYITIQKVNYTYGVHLTRGNFSGVFALQIFRLRKVVGCYPNAEIEEGDNQQ